MSKNKRKIEQLEASDFTLLGLLDNELLKVALSFLDEKDLCRVECTCHELKQISGGCWDDLADVLTARRLLPPVHENPELDLNSRVANTTKARILRYTVARDYAHHMERTASEHFNYDFSCFREESLRCSGCTEMPDLNTDVFENSEDYEYFMLLSQHRDDERQSGVSDEVMGTVLWQGFVPLESGTFVPPYPVEPVRSFQSLQQAGPHFCDLLYHSGSELQWSQHFHQYSESRASQYEENMLPLTERNFLWHFVMERKLCLTLVALHRFRPLDCCLVIASGGDGLLDARDPYYHYLRLLRMRNARSHSVAQNIPRVFPAFGVGSFNMELRALKVMYLDI